MAVLGWFYFYLTRKFKFIKLLCLRKWKIENGKWKMILIKNLYHDMF